MTLFQFIQSFFTFHFFLPRVAHHFFGPRVAHHFFGPRVAHHFLDHVLLIIFLDPVLLIFSIFCVMFIFLFVFFLYSMSNAANFSGLSILHSTFGVLQRLFVLCLLYPMLPVDCQRFISTLYLIKDSLTSTLLKVIKKCELLCDTKKGFE